MQNVVTHFFKNDASYEYFLYFNGMRMPLKFIIPIVSDRHGKLHFYELYHKNSVSTNRFDQNYF